MLEETRGELHSYMEAAAHELLMAREAHIKRTEKALNNLFSGHHAGADDISKAREFVKETAAAFELAQLRFDYLRR